MNNNNKRNHKSTLLRCLLVAEVMFIAAALVAVFLIGPIRQGIAAALAMVSGNKTITLISLDKLAEIGQNRETDSFSERGTGPDSGTEETGAGEPWTENGTEENGTGETGTGTGTGAGETGTGTEETRTERTADTAVKSVLKDTETTYAEEVVRLVNVERAKYNLPPLKADIELNAAAQIRAQECNTLFSHTRPNGTLCFSVLKEMNICYQAAAENIAIGQTTPEKVVQAWMNSDDHRKNILGNYTKIGVGVQKVSSDNRNRYIGYAWSQFFIK